MNNNLIFLFFLNGCNLNIAIEFISIFLESF